MRTSARPRVIVIGAGAFGRNHLRIYRELESAGAAVTLVGVVEIDQAKAERAAADYDVAVFGSLDECLARTAPVDAASVCVPTKQHASVATPLLERGIHCLIEKPLTATLEEADKLLELAREREVILNPGHLERFNPAVTAARAYLHHPMFFEAHRLSVFTPRSIDVDVVLDLMIHDLDIVLNLVNSPVRELRAVGLPVLSRNVDIANVRVEFENGSVANFTASRVSTERVRKLRFFQPHQYLSLDFARQELLLIDVSAAARMDPAQLATLAAAAQDPAAGAHPLPGLSLAKIPVEPGEPLRAEIEAFLASVRSGKEPPVTGQQGRAALALALSINAAIADHAHRAGLLL